MDLMVNPATRYGSGGGGGAIGFAGGLSLGTAIRESLIGLVGSIGETWAMLGDKLVGVGKELVDAVKDKIGDNGNDSSSGDPNKDPVKKTKHGKERAASRGFSEKRIKEIKEKPSHQVYQSGGRTVYAQRNGNFYDVVITNKAGETITTVGGNTHSLRTWSDVTKMLNNNGGYSSLPQI